jgi:3-demethoxyubiquinol 3-hydroxylase
MQIDHLIKTFDHGLRTVFVPSRAVRARPDADIAEADVPMLDEKSKQHAAALMRVNHVGEVCAQALYQGQAFTSSNPEIVKSLEAAAAEETDHLAWCEARIAELGGRKSMLNPLFYAGSFALGTAAGLMGDKWNLGFLAETEKQVGAHLQSHLDKLNPNDAKTTAIITQMHLDETAHAESAQQLGAAELPAPVKAGMKIASKLMTTTAYYL